MIIKIQRMLITYKLRHRIKGMKMKCTEIIVLVVGDFKTFQRFKELHILMTISENNVMQILHIQICISLILFQAIVIWQRKSHKISKCLITMITYHTLPLISFLFIGQRFFGGRFGFCHPHGLFISSGATTTTTTMCHRAISFSRG